MNHIGVAHRGVEPAMTQLMAIEVDGPDECLRVVAATEHCRVVRSVETGHGSQIALATVSASVAPFGCIFGLRILRIDAERTVRIVPCCVNGVAVFSTEHRHIFRSLQDVSAVLAIELLVVCRLKNRLIGGGFRHIVALCVQRTGRRLAHQLGRTVAIEVVDQELRVVSACTDVRAEVDSPHQGAVELQAINIDRTGDATM